MADRSSSPNERRPSSEARAFHWQGQFLHSRDAFFLLNQHRRLLAVNPRWEEITDLPLAEVRGLVCRRRAGTEMGPLEALAVALAPPSEVLEGRVAHVRRRVTGLKRAAVWWDLDFLPVQDSKGRTRVLGKLTPASVEEVPRLAPLPERLAGLRERLDQRYTFETLASESLSMRRVVDQVRLASQSGSPALIVGEPGCGKQWVARVIHHQGTAPERSFAAVDCAYLPPPALEEALFGPAGLLQIPGIRTVFLRDVSSLPRDLQARLCDHIDSAPAGSARLLASCRPDPTHEIKTQRLFDRLFASLGTLVIEIPPLRERRADLGAVIERMLARLNMPESKRVTGLTPAAAEIIQEHDWPGNLRELNALLAGAWRRSDGPLIDVVHLPRSLRLRRAVEQTTGAERAQTLALAPLLEAVERRLLTLALERCRGNKSRAAEMLGIWRMNLVRRLEKLGIQNAKNHRQDTDERRGGRGSRIEDRE